MVQKKNQYIEAQRLKGFPDFLPAAAAVRAHIAAVAQQQARLAGFSMVATPTLEYGATLCASEGQETRKEMYRFQDHGGRDVGLRFDLTVPLARFVAEHRADLLFPLRSLQCGNVFRGEKPQRGRYREFQLCDLDIAGTTSSTADVEVIALFCNILAQLQLGTWRLALGHRLLLNAVVSKIFPDLDDTRYGELLIVIDKLAKLERTRIAELLVAKSGGTATQAEEILAVLQLDLAGVGEFLRHDTHLETALTTLQQTLTTLQQLNSDSKGRIVFDLSIARGLDYYTGIVFETVLDDAPQLGAICSGGRYDNLIARFTSQPCAGVGGSIGIDRLVPHLVARAQATRTAAEVYVAVATATARLYALHTASFLRSKGVCTAMDVSARSLKHQLRYAHRGDYLWVVIVGDEEMQSETVTLRNMQTGVERKGIVRKILPMTIAAASDS